MNKKSINRIMLILIILTTISIVFTLLFIEKNVSFEKTTDVQIDYSDVWIDPNSYDKIEDFLGDKEILPELKLDISKNDFVICRQDEQWNITYTPFYHDFIKKWLFNIKEYKNEAIVDIYTSYKNDCLKWWYKSDSKTKIVFEEDISHNDTYLLNKIFTKETNIDDTIRELERILKKSIEKKELISYLYDLRWDYDKANQNRTDTCLENKITCDKKNKFRIYWKVLDDNNEPLSWVEISFLNNETDFSISNSEGEYSISLEYYPFSHLRFKAQKNWYSDWFKAISFNNSNGEWEKNENLNFHLNKAHYVENKNKNETIVKNWNKYFEFKTLQSFYLVPSNHLYYKDWDIWRGENIDVYMYEFKKSDNTSDLIQVDTFDDISGFVWNLMKTFWMPYIQFFDAKTNKELFVYKSNPMILQNNIYHMQELYDNYDGIYEAITKEDMEYLLMYSNEKGWYPIDFDFLTKNNFLRWPAWWALDRRKWIWESIPSKVLSVNWLIETEFYSINDL